MSTTLDEATHIYVGRDECGCVLGACVDDGDVPAEDLGEMVFNGLAVERRRLDEGPWRIGHECSES